MPIELGTRQIIPRVVIVLGLIVEHSMGIWINDKGRAFGLAPLAFRLAGVYSGLGTTPPANPRLGFFTGGGVVDR